MSDTPPPVQGSYLNAFIPAQHYLRQVALQCAVAPARSVEATLEAAARYYAFLMDTVYVPEMPIPVGLPEIKPMKRGRKPKDEAAALTANEAAEVQSATLAEASEAVESPSPGVPPAMSQVKPAIEYKEVQKSVMRFVSVFGKAAAIEKLVSFGVAKATEIDPANYAAVIAAFSEGVSDGV